MNICFDVDTALAEVPVNALPLIDDTDFKTREESIAYNAAGMDLIWHFVTSAGAYTATAVTPTTGGVYDWAHQDGGMYTIEIPASGGGSINNDTEGYGWFTGFCTGVLPWRSPTFCFRAAAINDAMVDGGDNLDVNAVQVGGQTASATGTVDFNDLATIEAVTTAIGATGSGLSAIPTIATVTNLTNAPTNGDLTATMKTSVTTAATAATPTAAAVTGAVGSVTAGVTLAAGAITDASLAGNMEIVFETDFATNYNVTRNAWVTNFTDIIGSYTAQTGDTYALANGAAGFTAIDTVVDSVKAVTDNLPSNGLLTDLPVDVTKISGDATAADNLELMYDGTGYTDDTAPSSRSQLGSLSSAAGGVSVTAESFTKTTGGTETNSYTATHQDDGTYHIVPPSAGTTDVYYVFDIGGNGIPQSFAWNGYAQSVGDSYAVFAYNWGGTSWEQIGTITASNGTTEQTTEWTATTSHVGTGANLGKVRLRFQSTDGTNLATDRVLCTYAVVARSVGYADGAIWVDTNASNTSTESYVDGVADNPVSTWGAALTLAGQLGITRFHVKGGSSITLTGNSDNYQIIGDGLYSLALGSQSVASAYIHRANLTGTASGTGTIYEDCRINNSVSIGPSYFVRCGFACESGTPFTANGAGEYALVDCVSVVAGSAAPAFSFAGTGGTSGVNIRRWGGGIDITLDTNNTLSHEVLAGGGQTITTGGASCEIRGIMRTLTVTMSATETVQFSGVCGPITLSGTTTGTVNLYGVSSSLSDSTSAATVADNTVSRINVNTECDTALSDYDPPTNAEMEARTLVAASYFDPAADTVATVTTVSNQVSADVTAISGSATAADNLEASALGIVPGACEGTPSTTVIQTDLAETTDDHYIGRIVVFTSGAAAGQASDITDYTGSTGTITVTALTTAPSASDTFVIV